MSIPVRLCARPPLFMIIGIFAAAMALPACISTTRYERDAAYRLSAADRATAAHAPAAAPGVNGLSDAPPVPAPAIDGSLGAYVAYAMHQAPSLRATYEDWRAAVHGIALKRRLPDPMLSYGYMVSPFEDFLDARRQRIGLRQTVPWPSKRRAAANAAADAALAAERRFEAQALGIRRRVADAFWRIWQIRESRAVEQRQRALLADLAAAVRVRIEVGRGSLADLTQLDLELARRDDALAGLDERELAATAALRAAIGAPAEPAEPVEPAEPLEMDTQMPIAADAPRTGLPAADTATLRQAARTHPRVMAMAAMADARRHEAERAAADRRPDVMVGVELMESMADSHAYPIMLMVGVPLPIWRDTYAAAEKQALAESAAFAARRIEAENLAQAELDEVLSAVRDAERRVTLYQRTLIPQAETAYAAVLGGYQAGTSTLASVLMAQKSLLELDSLLIDARADHARSWARMEEAVGQQVAAQEVPGDPGRSQEVNDE